MEEWVGHQWHRFITHMAQERAPHAAVALADMQRTLALLFRAGGGDACTRIAPAQNSATGGPRGWLQRVAGSARSANLGIWQHDTLALPAQINLFDDVQLNRALYLWLAALGACMEPGEHWIRANTHATAKALAQFPGLRPTYERLRTLQLAQRPAWERLPKRQALAEQHIQAALRGDVHAECSSISQADAAPVWLWFASAVSQPAESQHQRMHQEAQSANGQRALQDACRRAAQRVNDERNAAPLVMVFRAESIFSWAEFVKVNRADEDEDDGRQLQAANDMEELAIAEDGRSSASRVKFDLELPSAAQDDLPLGEGIKLPEWDWRSKQLLPEHCAARLSVARELLPYTPDARLRTIARRLQRHLDLARAAPDRIRGCTEGDDVDLDAWVRLRAHAGQAAATEDAPPIFIQQRRSERSLASLLLADLSQSTDAYATQDTRVIDLIRDALQVFGEALSTCGDAFEMLGFSSVRRQHVRMQYLKGFDEHWGPPCQQRIHAIKPGFYTRMGAAIRYASSRLSERPERQRLLLILTDGKPNDLDIYEGRYGLEDTRHAVQEARKAGLTPFCVTIDSSAHEYLPFLFGSNGYTLIHRAQDLSHRLASLYAKLTRD